MINLVLTRIIGTKNERELKRLRPLVQRIGELESQLVSLRDHELAAKTAAFRERRAGGASLDDLLPEAFAVVREAGRRALNMRHFDVQLIGGVVLHRGTIAEMKTGEGKTLVATASLYLNALTGRGAHLVTVNDFFARRDVQWMGPIFHALGVSVASIVHEASYLFDPTYVVKDY